MQGYQKRISRAFNKKVKSRNLKVGDLVLEELKGENFDPRGKMIQTPFYQKDHIKRSCEDY